MRSIRAGTAGALPRALYAQVLREALGRVELLESVQTSELSALRRVAKRHAGRPLSVEPVIFELVDSMLRSVFRLREPVSDRWSQMCRRVAASLWEDPAAHARLQRLWHRLSEDVR